LKRKYKRYTCMIKKKYVAFVEERKRLRSGNVAL
jgi:hypothetical protein